MTAGVTGGLRGRKRSQYEGGVRVPAFAKWPDHIPAGSVVDAPLSTLDYLPTVQRIVDYPMQPSRPIDGIDMLPILLGKPVVRTPIPFRVGKTASLIDGRYKLVIRDYAGRQSELYDLQVDLEERLSIAADHTDVVKRMTDTLQTIEASVRNSHAGGDYETRFTPSEAWVPLVNPGNN